MTTNHLIKIVSKAYQRFLASVFVFTFAFSPLSVLASTPIDSEIKTSQSHWYSFLSYFEIYEVNPSSRFFEQIARVVNEEKLSSDSRINFYLLRHITAVKEIESKEELRAYQRAIGNISTAFRTVARS